MGPRLALISCPCFSCHFGLVSALWEGDCLISFPPLGHICPFPLGLHPRQVCLLHLLGVSLALTPELWPLSRRWAVLVPSASQPTAISESPHEPVSTLWANTTIAPSSPLREPGSDISIVMPSVYCTLSVLYPTVQSSQSQPTSYPHSQKRKLKSRVTFHGY